MKTSKAYRFRFYPTVEQAQLLSRTFGCIRYVYNWALKAKTDAYYNECKRLYYKNLSAKLTILKQQPETVWLNEVSSVALQQELRHLDRAFIHFFEGRAEYPQFHKKHGKQSATFASSAFKWDGRTVVKIDKFYPSSKRCYDCGHIMPKMPLSVREWTCPECGETHDRDINAAQNILAAGLAVLVCGEALRPRRKQSSRQGKLPRSRKANKQSLESPGFPPSGDTVAMGRRSSGQNST